MTTSRHARSPRRTCRAKAIVAVAVSGAMLVGAGAYATLVGVTANRDSGGTGTLPECQPISEPLHAQTDTPVLDPAAGAFVTTGVTIDNIDAACQNAQLGLYVTASEINGHSLQSFGPLLITASSHHFALTAGPGSTHGLRLEDIVRWTLAIHPMALGAPSGLAAAASGATSVALGWTAPSAPSSNPVIDYLVQVSANAGATWTTYDDGVGTDTTATVSGLTTGSTYLFRVSTVNSAGTGRAVSSSAVTLAVPDQPTNVGAAAASSTTVDLSWTAPAAVPGAPLTDYVIDYSTDNEVHWTSYGAGVSTASTATIGGLAVGASYWFRVSAVNAVGTGLPGYDDPVVMTTVPGEPRNVTGSSVSAGVVGLSWTVPADNGGSAITDYVVQYAAADGTDTWRTFTDGTSTATSATVTGLTDGAPGYYIRVSALNVQGAGAYSTDQPLVVAAGVPSAPGGITVDAGTDHADVAWTAPADNGGVPIADYTVSTPRGDGTFASCTTTVLTCRLTGLAPSTPYLVTVTATNVAGHVRSATANATTTASHAVPGSPLGVSGTPSDRAVRVTWTAPVSDGGLAITAYAVTASPGGATCTSAGLSCVVSGLTDGTPYTFTVTATNADGTSAASAASSPVTPASVPSAPLALDATSPGISGQIDLAWTAPASTGGATIVDYRVQSSADDGATWTDVTRDPSAARTATVIELDDTRDYLFRVAAVNVVGTGPASVPSSPVPPTSHSGDPGIVTGLTTTPQDDGMALAWTTPAYLGGLVTGYQVQYQCTRVPGARQDHCADTAPFQSWSDWYTTTTAAPSTDVGYLGVNAAEIWDGNDYMFRIRVLITVGGVTHTGTAIETTGPDRPNEGCVPNAPVAVTATVSSPTSIGLSWTGDPGGLPTGMPLIGCLGVPMDPRTHYYVMYQSSTDGGTTWSGWSSAIDTASIETTTNMTGLSQDTRYRFLVQEWPDNDNRSTWSTPSNEVTTGHVVVAPGRPTDLTATPGGTAATVTWTAPAGTGGAAIDSYRVTAYADVLGLIPAFGPTNPQTLTPGGTFTGLVDGTSYYFRVAAHNSAGWGTLSDVSTALVPRTAASAPGAPSVDASAGDGTVALTWTAPASNGGAAVTDYVVQVSSDGGTTWSTFGHSVLAGTSVTVTGLSTGLPYVVRVAAVNVAGTGSFSASSSTVTPFSVPSSPTSLLATPEASLAVAQSTTYVDLSWATPLDNGGSALTGYAVQLSTDGGTTWATPTFTTPTSTSAHVTGLPVSTTVQLRVRAVTSATRGSDAGYRWAVTTVTTATPPAPSPPPPPAVPNAVTSLSATPGDTVVSLTWNASVATGAAVTGYSVRYSANGGTSWSAAVTTSSTSMTVSGLTNAALHTFAVSPTSSSGNGTAGTITATPSSAPVLVPPKAVGGLAASAGVQAAGLTWTAPATSSSNAVVTGYVVQRSTDRSSWTTLTTIGSSQLSYLVTGLTSGMTYYFRVFATSTVGNGAVASSVSAVPVGSTAYQILAGSAAWTGGTVVLQAGTSVLSYETKTNLTYTATGSMAVSPVGTGYGLWVRASFTNNQISGYSFQVDPGQGNNFVVRWWTNAKERSVPWATAKFPPGFDPNVVHRVSITVSDLKLTATVDGATVLTTVLPTKSETVGDVTFVPNSEGRYGFRTWYPTIATLTDITVSDGAG